MIEEDYETDLDVNDILIFTHNGEKYEQVYRKDNVYTAVKIFFLKADKKKESQTIKNASNATITEVSKFKISEKFDTDPKDLTDRNIQYEKLSPKAYPYFTNFPSLLQEVEELRKNGDKTFSLDKLSDYLKQAEEVTFTKELERAQLFYEELNEKLKGMDLEVKHEYGKTDEEKNPFSKCGRSKIDIVLQISGGKRKEQESKEQERLAGKTKGRNTEKEEIQKKKYTAGAVMELKTNAPVDDNTGQWTAAHSQTAYEMLKLGTDKAIEDKLKQGEQVDVIIVYGILVYMDSRDTQELDPQELDTQKGVVMELRLDFTSSPQPNCITVDERGRIKLKKAFQLVMGKLIPDAPPPSPPPTRSQPLPPLRSQPITKKPPQRPKQGKTKMH